MNLEPINHGKSRLRKTAFEFLDSTVFFDTADGEISKKMNRGPYLHPDRVNKLPAIADVDTSTKNCLRERITAFLLPWSVINPINTEHGKVVTSTPFLLSLVDTVS